MFTILFPNEPPSSAYHRHGIRERADAVRIAHSMLETTRSYNPDAIVEILNEENDQVVERWQLRWPATGRTSKMRAERV